MKALGVLCGSLFDLYVLTVAFHHVVKKCELALLSATPMPSYGFACVVARGGDGVSTAGLVLAATVDVLWLICASSATMHAAKANVTAQVRGCGSCDTNERRLGAPASSERLLDSILISLSSVSATAPRGTAIESGVSLRVNLETSSVPSVCTHTHTQRSPRRARHHHRLYLRPQGLGTQKRVLIRFLHFKAPSVVTLASPVT